MVIVTVVVCYIYSFSRSSDCCWLAETMFNTRLRIVSLVVWLSNPVKKSNIYCQKILLLCISQALANRGASSDQHFCEPVWSVSQLSRFNSSMMKSCKSLILHPNRFSIETSLAHKQHFASLGTMTAKSATCVTESADYLAKLNLVGNKLEICLNDL